MNDTASSTGSALAISETGPKRPAGGCVAIFFQLFDWNRKKLFSKRLLPPGRGKKIASDEKLPNLRLIADANNPIGAASSTSLGKNGVQTPSLVARLMGLESMPSVNRNGEFNKETTLQEFRPQKLQKTETVTRFGAETLQLKNVLSRSRKHHSHHPKLASPVKRASHHAKRSTSRLIGAATRILEPGLQSKKFKHAVTYYPHSIRTPNELRTDYTKNGNLDLSRKHTSCKNSGNLVDLPESIESSKRDFENPSHVSPLNGNSRYAIDQERKYSTNPVPYFSDNNIRKTVVDVVGVSSQLKSNRATSATDGVSDTKDFVALNRTSLSGRGTRSRVPYKVEDTKFDNCSSPGKKRQLTHIRKQGESCLNKGNGTKNSCEVSTKVERRRNQNVSPSRKKITLNHQNNQTDDSLCARLEKKLHELMSRVEYESGINGSQLKRTPSNNFQDLIYALNMERLLPQINHLPRHCSKYDHKTSFRLQPKSEKPGELTRGRNSNHLSPGSVLEASFSNDSCCSSTLEDSSVRTQHADSTIYSYNKSQFQHPETNPFYSGVLFTKENTRNKLAAADFLSYISKVLSSIDLVNSRISGNIYAHIKEVIFYSDLVLANQIPDITRPNRPNEINHFFVCDLLLELDTLVEIMWAKLGNIFGSRNLNAGNQLKRFVFHALIEYLDSKYVRYSKCGFRTWAKQPRFMGSGVFVGGFAKEVRGWLGATSDDELVSLGRWSDYEIEGYETGAIISGDILEMLVHEIVVDLV